MFYFSKPTSAKNISYGACHSQSQRLLGSSHNASTPLTASVSLKRCVTTLIKAEETTATDNVALSFLSDENC